MRPTLLSGAVLLSVAAFGCAAETRTYAESPAVYTEPAPTYTEPAPAYSEPAPTYTEPAYEPEPVVFHEPPPLVAIEPDVYVVHNYPVPVYYVGGFYWRFHAGLWYRAADYNTGWASVNVGVVPRPIIYRNHSHYVRYSPARATVYRAPIRHHATSHTYRRPVPIYRTPASSYRSTAPTYRSTAPTYKGPSYRPPPVAPRAVPQRQVVRPGYVQERSVPQRRPVYNEPVQRQRVRGREAPPARPRVQPAPRPQPPRSQPPQPRRDDRRRVPPNTGHTHDHPHKHGPQKQHHR